MSVTVVLQIEAAEGKTDDIIAFFRKNLPDPRSYDGFESLTVHRDLDESAKLLVFEQWAIRGDFET